MSVSPGVEFYESRIIEEAIKLAEAVDLDVFTQAAEKMAEKGSVSFVYATILNTLTRGQADKAQETGNGHCLADSLEGFAQALISSAKTIRRCADAEEGDDTPTVDGETITVTREHEVHGRQEGKVVFLNRPADMPVELFEEAVSEFSRHHPDLLFVIND